MDSLEQAVRAQSLVFVAGSGVSASTTRGESTATWVGLIESGLAKVSQLDSGLNSTWSELVRRTLDYGLASEDPASLIQAAGMISKAFKKLGPQAFANWLSEDIGNLRVVEDATAKSLLALPFPILTTNYDTLLETIGRRTSAVWNDPKSIQSLLTGQNNAIGHLHGVWDQPDSVVLSESDYSALMSRGDTQGLQQGFSSIKSLVYIGFGMGLDDPNFSSLLTWHRETFPTSGVTHFRLCLNSELSSLKEIHRADNIQPINYGETFGELPIFLNNLLPERASIRMTQAGIARDVISEIQQSWADSLKSDSIIAEILGDNSRGLSDLLLPPVLLPVPFSEYVKAKSSKNRSERIERLNPERETQEADVVLLVAEDGAGLTTAIRWMAWKASINLGSAAPLYVNFRQCGQGLKPLEDQVRNMARNNGLLPQKNSELPPYVLALDDFSASVSRISDRVVKSLASNEAVFTVIGCKQGYEDEILSRFKAAGIQVRVRYLGRLDSYDIEKLAQFASPTGFENLAKNVIAVLLSENLPRTPFTASLLISILIRGGTVASSASQTSILEQYVSDLLGRGDPHEDARFSIDQSGREVLLANLAQHFVNKSLSAISETEIVDFFSSVFDRFGWTESPTAMLTNFLDRRVLRRSGTYIEFSRASYLYLFAAKRAGVEDDFLTALSERPLYYAPVLKAYSALTRRDSRLLARVSALFSELSEGAPDRGSPFQELELTAPTQSAVVGPDEEEDSAHADAGSNELQDRRPSEEYSSLDTLDDNPPPFPGESETDLPYAVRLMKILDLVSTVLRDSDQIEDLQLKRKVLIQTLTAWGTLISALNADGSFQNVMRELATELLDELLDPNVALPEPNERLEIIDEILKAIPAAIALGGIATTLASRKLIAIFSQALQANDFESADETAIGAAFFVYALREKGWPTQLRHILEHQGNLWVVRHFLWRLCTEFYIHGNFSRQDESELLALCVEVLERSTRYNSSAQRADHLDKFKLQLKRRRLQSESKSIGPRTLELLADNG